VKYRDAIVFSAGSIVFAAANAQVSISPSQGYTQNFDGLTTQTTAQTWTNDSTLAGWSLFNPSGNAFPTYLADNGGSNGGSFKSFGTTGSSDRAFGAVTSGGAYYGSITSGPVGYIALALNNNSGGALDSLTLSYAGEQWRNGGNATVPSQSIVLQYGFGATYAAVGTWLTPGGSFDFTSPVTTSTSGAVDGNVAGRVGGLGGTLSGLTWNNGDTLWMRWTYVNNTGNDHGLAIDDLSVSVTAATAVPEPSQYALMLAGLGAIGLVARRRIGNSGRV